MPTFAIEPPLRPGDLTSLQVLASAPFVLEPQALTVDATVDHETERRLIDWSYLLVRRGYRLTGGFESAITQSPLSLAGSGLFQGDEVSHRQSPSPAQVSGLVTALVLAAGAKPSSANAVLASVRDTLDLILQARGHAAGAADNEPLVHRAFVDQAKRCLPTLADACVQTSAIEVFVESFEETPLDAFSTMIESLPVMVPLSVSERVNDVRDALLAANHLADMTGKGRCRVSRLAEFLDTHAAELGYYDASVIGGALCCSFWHLGNSHALYLSLGIADYTGVPDAVAILPLVSDDHSATFDTGGAAFERLLTCWLHSRRRDGREHTAIVDDPITRVRYSVRPVRDVHRLLLDLPAWAHYEIRPLLKDVVTFEPLTEPQRRTERTLMPWAPTPSQLAALVGA